MGKEKTIIVIPARGNSKTIPYKNLLSLYGKPILKHVVDTALSVDGVEVWVSSEDRKILELCKEWDVNVIVRPRKLSNDNVGTSPVLVHAVEQIGCVDKLVLLYATSPLISKERIVECISMLDSYDSVIGVYENCDHHWIRDHCGQLVRLYPKVVYNRQWNEPCYTENGAIYGFKPFVLTNDSFISSNVSFLVMDKYETIDIDTLDDFQLVKKLYKDNCEVIPV